jgi:hypothetical protein
MILLGEAGEGGDNLTNVQCKTIENWHNEFLLYNEYMIIRIKKIIKKGEE